MLRSDIASKLGRFDLGVTAQVNTGTSVDYPTDSAPGGIGIGGKLSISAGRDSLLLLALLTVGIIAFSYWTR